MIGFCDFQILSLEDIEDFAGTDFPAAFVAGLFHHRSEFRMHAFGADSQRSAA